MFLKEKPKRQNSFKAWPPSNQAGQRMLQRDYSWIWMLLWCAVIGLCRDQKCHALEVHFQLHHGERAAAGRQMRFVLRMFCAELVGYGASTCAVNFIKLHCSPRYVEDRFRDRRRCESPYHTASYSIQILYASLLLLLLLQSCLLCVIIKAARWASQPSEMTFSKLQG